MDDYECIKKSSLKFKGEKRKKRRKDPDGSRASDHLDGSYKSEELNEAREDADNHGGWWKVSNVELIKEDVAIELFIPGCYAKAMSNGTIVMGNPHPPGEGPDEEEIFTAIAPSTDQVAFKSGFGRYLGVDPRKRLMGTSEAVGEREIFIPVFEEGKLALSAFNECFLSPEQDTGSDNPQILARAMTAGPSEMLTIRTNNEPNLPTSTKQKLTAENSSKLDFPFKEDKILKKARMEGRLQETLLDMRAKKKSDKYCK